MVKDRGFVSFSRLHIEINTVVPHINCPFTALFQGKAEMPKSAKSEKGKKPKSSTKTESKSKPKAK